MGHPQVTKIYNEEKLYSVRPLVVVHILNFQRDLVETQSSAPEDGRNCRPKHVELIEIINKIIIVASSWLFILLLLLLLVFKNMF